MSTNPTPAPQLALAASRAFELPVYGFNELIRAHAQHRGAMSAFIDGDSTMSWAQFEQRTARVAQALVLAGIRKGERIAMLTANSLWAYEVLFGIIRAGAVVAPLSTLLPPALQAKLLLDCDARILLAGRGCERLAVEGATATNNRVRLILEAETGDTQHSYQAFIANGTGEFEGVSAAADDTFGIIYSSGTTGVPKGIMHSHAGRLGMAWQSGSAAGISPSARCLIATPPSSNGSMIMLLPAIFAGATCILARSVAPDDFFGLLSRRRPTHAFLVPTQLGSIFTDPRADHADFSGLRCLLSAGATLPAQLKRRVLELAGHCFHEAWGFTEGVGTMIGPEEAAQRPQSVGRPLPGTEIRVIDAEGVELRAPAVGELVGRSIMMMQGYLNRPDANAAIRWRDASGQTFLRTGDIAEIDLEGFITLRGRIKDMIISGGLNVYPSDLEAALLEHPSVLDAAVIGVPHERWGEVPVAYVTAKAGVDIDVAAMKEWTNARVAKHQRLADVMLHSHDFPRNVLGKVLKGELQAAYRRQHDSAVN